MLFFKKMERDYYGLKCNSVYGGPKEEGEGCEEQREEEGNVSREDGKEEENTK